MVMGRRRDHRLPADGVFSRRVLRLHHRRDGGAVPAGGRRGD
eukprot:COSAG04_NODE_19855_length_406_cov_3.143322_2_plen_41_part_01